MGLTPLMGYYKAMWEKKLRSTLKSVHEEGLFQSNGKSAAVLLLLSPSQEPHHFEILLTKRTTKVETHKGQVSLPGGFREEADRNWQETALRETFEEIGLESSAIELLGMLAPVQTKGQVFIIPFVGVLRGQRNFQINPEEVEKLFFLPSQELLHRGLNRVLAREGEIEVPSVGITWEGELIWGATAKILGQIYNILKA